MNIIGQYGNRTAHGLSSGSASLRPSDPLIETNSRIRDGVTYLESQMADLHSIISSLESRLDTVLVPSPPQPASVNQSKDGGSGPPPSPLFERMGSLSNVAAEAQARLRAILSRIEV